MQTTIGFLGGGQLAALLAQSALERDFSIVAYCESVNDPITPFCEKIFVGERGDVSRLRHFFQQVDYVLLESEFFSAKILKSLSQETATPVFPNLDDYQKLYTKKGQKALMDEVKVPYAKTISLGSADAINSPHILKLSHGGYDGYGNTEVSNFEEVLSAIGDKDPTDFFLEEKLELEAEYACLLVKGKRDSYIFDPCETIQRDQKCLFVIDNPNTKKELKQKIKEYVSQISKKLEGPGIYAFEFFVDSEERVLFNEAAPRVHNSYHFSIEGYSYSQFDMFINAVLDEELYIPHRRFDDLTMLNIVGRNQGAYQLRFPYKENLSPYKIHMYGKAESRPGRKLGHITFFGENDTFESAKWVEQEHQI